ncbi:protein JTB-like [Liolophura sinensis]|uniref:protein JTB-like n=1 Tax=Liolophura sinensis TaxID=3198878 RepID=UPI0031584653
MIEFCSKKRMLAVVFTLVTISVVSVVLETRWSAQHKVKEISRKGKGDSNETCKLGKEKVVESCRECLADELFSEKKYCQETGFRTVVACEDGTKIMRMCSGTQWLEERNFWIFEGVTFAIGILSYGLVVIRQHRLDRMLREKIDRQIAADI